MKIPYYTCLTFFENEKQKLKTKTTKSCFGFFVLKTIKQESVFSVDSRKHLHQTSFFVFENRKLFLKTEIKQALSFPF